jgi:uncharacterized membrane protein SpoIIM required for sporulation
VETKLQARQDSAATRHRFTPDAIAAEVNSSLEVIGRLESSRSHDQAELRAAAEAYERIVGRFAYASTFYPGSQVAREAMRAVHLGRRLIYGRRLSSYTPHQRSFRLRVVEAFRPLRVYAGAAAAVMAVSAVLTFAMVLINPALGWNFVNEETAENLKNGQLWTEGIQGMSSIASSEIMTNNIKVCLLSFAAGITVGGIFAALLRYQMQGRLFEFIVGHGVLELSIIAVSAGCGLYIGDGLLNPGALTRREALQIRGRASIEVLLYSSAWLVVAGIIEGYVSPYPDLSFWTKAIIGVTLGASYWWCLLSSKENAARG